MGIFLYKQGTSFPELIHCVTLQDQLIITQQGAEFFIVVPITQIDIYPVVGMQRVAIDMQNE